VLLGAWGVGKLTVLIQFLQLGGLFLIQFLQPG
jgi:hypothetical protein